MLFPSPVIAVQPPAATFAEFTIKKTTDQASPMFFKNVWVVHGHPVDFLVLQAAAAYISVELFAAVPDSSQNSLRALSALRLFEKRSQTSPNFTLIHIYYRTFMVCAEQAGFGTSGRRLPATKGEAVLWPC
jgi:hypothetical protein